MRERDTAVLTSGAVAITVLFVLLLGNVFVYVPMKAAYFGPAHTTTVTVDVTCATDTCELEMSPSVVGKQEKLNAIDVYAVQDATMIPQRPPDASIQQPQEGMWNDATLNTTVTKSEHYLLVARQKPTANGAQWAAGMFDDTPNSVIIDRVDVETTEQA